MKHPLFSVIVLAFVCSILTSRGFADDPLARGKAALAKGDLPAAIDAFREAVKDNSKNKEAFILLGTALYRADSLDQATAALVQARELDTADCRTYELLGDVYAKENIAAGAVDQYKQAVAHGCNTPALHLKIAELARKARQYNEAIQEYQQVLAAEPNNLAALSGASTILYRAKHYFQALPFLEKLYAMRPDSLPVLVMYARSLGENDSCDKFIPLADSVLERDKMQTEIEDLQTNCYIKTGKLDKYISSIRQKKLSSLKPDELIRFAKALRTTGTLDSAVMVYKMVLDKDSSRCDYLYDFGTLYMKVKKYNDAINVFEKKIACDTTAGYGFASHLNIAMCLMQLKKFKDAREHIQDAIKLRPDNIQAWQTLAQDEAQLENSSAEVEAYKKVLELAGPDPDPRYNNAVQEANKMIGVRYLLDKKYPDAVKYLIAALKFDSKDCQLLLWTAQAYHNSNNKEEAKRYYCKVLDNCKAGKEAKDAQNGLDILGMKCGE